MLIDPAANDLVVTRQRRLHRIRIVLPQPRRTLKSVNKNVTVPDGNSLTPTPMARSPTTK